MATRADFYVLNGQSDDQRIDFCCRLAAKAWRSGLAVGLRAEDEAQAGQLDQRLWSIPAAGFIPHALVSSGLSASVSVLIGSPSSPAPPGELLINLAQPMPDNLSSYERIAEIISDQADIVTAGRKKYRQYQRDGLSLHSHTISPGKSDGT